jgi:hypothetical protein
MQTLTLAAWLLICTVFIPAARAQGASPVLETRCIHASNGPATAHVNYRYVTSEGDGEESGTGFVISLDGHMLTNAHVVSPRSAGLSVQSETITVQVGGLTAQPYEAKVVARDAALDLALLKLPSRLDRRPWQAVTVGQPVNLPVGSPLVALGFSSGDVALVPDGIKTAHNTFVNGELRPWWQTNLALNSGNSGGPIFSELGTVVAIAVARNSGAQLISFVIPISLAAHLLDAANVRPSQAGPCAVFPECPDTSRVTRYEIDQPVSGWGDWRRGGYNQNAFCNDYLKELQLRHPQSIFTRLRSDEQSREVSTRRFEYRYFCEFLRQERPVYAMQRTAACLPARQ